MLIEPPYAHEQVPPDPSMACPPTRVLDTGLFHGPTGIGRHGIGVSTPSAAAVAAITIGLAGLWHIPNGNRFRKGTLSVTTATGRASTITWVTGRTTSTDGAVPIAHSRTAPATTGDGLTSCSWPR